MANKTISKNSIWIYANLYLRIKYWKEYYTLNIFMKKISRISVLRKNVFLWQHSRHIAINPIKSWVQEDLVVRCVILKDDRRFYEGLK